MMKESQRVSRRSWYSRVKKSKRNESPVVISPLRLELSIYLYFINSTPVAFRGTFICRSLEELTWQQWLPAATATGKLRGRQSSSRHDIFYMKTYKTREKIENIKCMFFTSKLDNCLWLYCKQTYVWQKRNFWYCLRYACDQNYYIITNKRNGI